MKITKCSKISFLLGAALLAVLTGCVGYVDSPGPVAGYVQEDYVYYPGHEVYYGGHSHQYVYREGSAWVSRPAPPRVTADVLLAAPSVRLDFHDHPSNHHAAIAQQYPKQWAPPGSDRGRKEGHNDRN